jgi:hypothetical protein
MTAAPSIVDDAPFVIDVFTPDYSGRLDRFSNYNTAFFAKEWCGVGTGTITVPATHPMAGAFLSCDDTVVPVRATSHGRIWTGRVGHTLRDGPMGNQVVTATLVDEWPWFSSVLAWGDPLHPLNAQVTPTDDRTGPLETVVKGFIRDNMARLATAILPFYVVPPPVVDSSPVVTLSARFTPIDDLVLDVVKANNRSLLISMWMPGDPQPPGTTLTAPTLVVDIATTKDDARVTWSDTFGGVTGLTVNVSAPHAYMGIAGGTFTGLARILTAYTDPALAQSLGRAGFPEYFLNDTSSTPELVLAKLVEDMALHQTGQASIAVTVLDGAGGLKYGRDYHVGDIGGAAFSGVQSRDRITRVEESDDRTNGFSVTPIIGQSNIAASSSIAVLRTVAKLRSSINALNART